MPVVRSYFRRSPGVAGMADATAPARRLDVAIFDATGTNLLRDRFGARYTLENLQFSTGLPGGFNSAAFTLRRPVANNWAGRPGYAVAIRRGNTVVWWGWLEDFRRTVRGATEALTVTALGPWQAVQQRLCSPSYTAVTYGDAVLAEKLRLYCTDISADYTLIEPTGVDLAPISWTNKPISDLVKVVCDSGDSAGRMMQFAVWEPTYRNRNGYPINLLTNGDMETASGSPVRPTGWALTTSTGDPQWVTSTTKYRSPMRSLRIFNPDPVPGSVASGYVSRNVSVTAGTSYTVDYCVWHDNSYSGTITAHVEITWLKADNSFISTVGTTHTYSGTGAWYRYIDTHVAPALAATAKVRLWFSLPYGYYLGVNYDDVYMFVTGTAAAMDRKPRAALWPRDLTGYDYVLHTSELETGLAIDESTRDLANNVAATYGTASVTAFAGNTASQTTYRKREAVVAAGSVAATVAAAMRDTYLAEHLTPKVELAPFTLARRGALRTALGAVVWPESVRAGHRVLLADGPNAGSVFVVATTGYNNGAVTLTPERLDDTAMLLARR